MAGGSRQVGDIWWDNVYSKAMIKTVDGGVELSGEPFVQTDQVFVTFFKGNKNQELSWRVPHLIPTDLEKGAFPLSNPDPPNKPKAKAKPKNKADKPVPNYDLPTIRYKYCLQGKNPPIIKIECREDRFDMNSKWKQKLQIVIKDSVTLNMASNVSRTFCDAYHNMTLNPRLLDFRECRQALLEHDHDWEKGPLNWEIIARACIKGFPTK